jgi:hypothetical protein
MKCGSSTNPKIAILYTYTGSTAQGPNVMPCRIHTWELLRTGETQIAGFDYEAIFRGPNTTKHQIINCLTKAFTDAKKNKEIRKFRIFEVKD